MDVIAQTTTTASTSTTFALVILVCIVVCALIWKNRGGKSWVGALLGWVLGPFGILAVLVAKPKAAKSRAASSIPATPVPDRPDSFPLPPNPDVVATQPDRLSES
jgi:hypothetical protein